LIERVLNQFGSSIPGNEGAIERGLNRTELGAFLASLQVKIASMFLELAQHLLCGHDAVLFRNLCSLLPRDAFVLTMLPIFTFDDVLNQ
jgi:hypothetical protein